MESITIQSNLDLKTYYIIALMNIVKRAPIIIVFFMFLIMTGSYIYYGYYDNETITIIIIWAVLFFILLPLTTWLRCKKNMVASPVLAEGATYHISENYIENISPSITCKTNWKYITKVTETDKSFIMNTSMLAIHYLPKDGFTSSDDISKFKEMVKSNNIKAYFK